MVDVVGEASDNRRLALEVAPRSCCRRSIGDVQVAPATV